MKKRRILAVFIAICIAVQSFFVTSVSAISNGNIVSEQDMLNGYEEFMQYVRNEDLPVSMDYQSFCEEYSLGAYDSVDEYLDELYFIIQELSKPAEPIEKTDVSENKVVATTSSNKDLGVAYSDEILDAYKDFVKALSEQNIISCCLEVFLDEYSKSGIEDISEFCESFVEQYEDNAVQSRYYYNIGGELSQLPDYDEYNILQMAQRGDVILDANDSGGIL